MFQSLITPSFSGISTRSDWETPGLSDSLKGFRGVVQLLVDSDLGPKGLVVQVTSEGTVSAGRLHNSPSGPGRSVLRLDPPWAH